MVKRYLLLLAFFFTLGMSNLYSKETYHLVLYSNPNCPYCQKVLHYLQKEGKSLPIKNTQDKKNKENLIKIGGKSQVPCLIINGEPLYESSQILEWLKTHKNAY